MIYTIEINSFFCYTGTNIRIQPSVKLIPKKAYKGGMTDEATQISGISGRGTGKQGARTGGLFRDMVWPRQMMGLVLEQLSAEYEGKAKIVKVDIDESMDLAQKYRIMSVPNMIIFKDGAPVDAVIGAVPANHLKEKLDAVL